ncbi:uncharacterized protein PFL1_05275 [Pseudozyma flocculosa PF-1]|uniref:Tyrosine specific protein phosphatases domain-containing protein n=1 Tax=Pseudozyma flocculosa PF-1 TaxID=1277687 RepID=A0A061H4J1_9BASI|nr:uncharacterized protein PFL1_05275 [Pseudozyma flocculosa PF-1]EPQ27354.1 hypothetical protein PFL1_05275 [Pseudozyma flocculosa PF-1]
MSQPVVQPATPLTPPLSVPAFRSPALVPAEQQHQHQPSRSPFFSPSSSHGHNGNTTTVTTAQRSSGNHASSPPQSHKSPTLAAAAAAASRPNGSGAKDRPASSALITSTGQQQEHHRPLHSIHHDLAPDSSSKLKADPVTEFSIQRKPQDRQPSLMRDAQLSQEEAIHRAHQQQHHAQPQLTQQQQQQQQAQQQQAQQQQAQQQQQQQQQQQNTLLLQHYQERDALVEDAFRAARESGNQEWIVLMDLSRFASQHHMSPYSLMKFGPRGSPFAYVPITLQRPDAVEQTMSQQRQSERQAVEWLINKKRKRGIQLREQREQQQQQQRTQSSTPVLKISLQDLHREPPASMVGTKRSAAVITPPNARATSLLRTCSTEGSRLPMEDQLSQAMSDSIRATAAPPESAASSSTESLPIDDQNESESKINDLDRSTRMVEIKDAKDRSDGTGHDGLANGSPTSSQATAGNGAAQAGSSVMVNGPLTTQEIYVQDLEKASPTEKPGHVPPHEQQRPPPVAAMPPSQQASLAMKTSDTHPIHISPIVPENLLQEISDRILAAAPPQFVGEFDGIEDGGDGGAEVGRIHQPTPSFIDPVVHEREQALGRRLSQAQIADQAAAEAQEAAAAAAAAADETSISPSKAVTASQPSSSAKSPTSARRPCIGNMLLSSCPGKKVRLSGPVRGRGAICRDLGLDLKRIYGLGIRAVVCCLDNDELAYLGAPWEDYEREADSLGLDVIRLPMAEGFAPTCVTRMDDAITALIQDYTLRGKSILVHCRGGVGRAGLSACLWMLKLGLVGPSPLAAAATAPSDMPIDNGGAGSGDMQSLDGAAERLADATAATVTNATPAIANTSESQAVLDTVERLIETIRRRRSPKAIETAEQVKFIVEFVMYLHRQEALVRQNGADAAAAAAGRSRLL